MLRKLTDDAAKFLNDKVERAVVTVPAYFNDSQRQVRTCAMDMSYNPMQVQGAVPVNCPKHCDSQRM